jgi:hypothetical protein
MRSLIEPGDTYAERRRALLIELRMMRRTNPSKRVVKYMQSLLRILRFAHREGVV